MIVSSEISDERSPLLAGTSTVQTSPDLVAFESVTSLGRPVIVYDVTCRTLSTCT